MKESKLSDGMCDCVAGGINDNFILAYNHNNDDYIDTKTIIVERDQT